MGQWFFHTLKELNDLNNKYSKPEILTLKQKTKILIIDDNDVPFLDILISNDYNIKKIDDIEDMGQVNAYDIILCDVNGIAKKLSPEGQGAHVVKESKKLYPYKQVIAFSAFSADAQDDDIKEMLNKADDFLPKDAGQNKWMQVLDQCITNHGDPFEQWKRISRLLLKNGVSTKYVALMESNFVEAVIKKDPSKFLIDNSEYRIPGFLKDILSGFISSVLGKVILGA